MKTLKIIRIIGGVVFASAAIYFFIEKEYTEAVIQTALFLFLSLIPLVFNKENEWQIQGHKEVYFWNLRNYYRYFNIILAE